MIAQFSLIVYNIDGKIKKLLAYFVSVLSAAKILEIKMKDAKKILDAQFDQMVETLQKVISFKTEKGPATATAPFGVNVANCLQYVLDLAESWGLQTYNCDNYAGHADFVGAGKEVLGILGHLDVVPAKAEEWRYPPYEGVIDGGKLYGRGAMDDKGPMIACLFAVKALKEAGFSPKKTVRLIFGCDEETDMQCVQHYFTKKPRPDVAFSPDGDFPVINREKGIYHFDIKCGKLPQGVTLQAGDRANVVASKCCATIQGAVVDISKYPKLSVTKQGDTTVITSVGKAAHASTPQEGVNATHDVLHLLAEMYPDSEVLQFAAHKLCDTTGKAWGINLCDKESGNLTCNVGVLKTDSEGNLTITMDIRFPVTYNCDYMTQLLRKNTPQSFELVPWHVSDPLFVPGDSKLVTTLMKVYNKDMKTNLEPIAIGGGTYSRCLSNCVAFGPLFPGEEQTIHMPNECVSLTSLKQMAEVYLDAIYELSKD